MTKQFGRLLYLFPALGVVCFLLLAYAYFIEPNRLVVRHTSLIVKNWDPAFDGLKVVMIGDIHGGSNNVTEEKLRRIVTIANEQDADLIVLLGDYVSEKGDGPKANGLLKMPMATIADNLAGFRARSGVYAVLGNHDGWYSPEIITREFARVGVRVLSNEVVALERGGQTLRILGLADHMTIGIWKLYSDNAKRVLAEDGRTGNILALQHSPDVLPVISGNLSISPDLRLMLAAHTHGGQVWFPILGTPIVPSSYGQKYSYGYIRENDVDMFVTTGIGTSVLPIRFMMPPEIAVLTIRSE